MENIMSALLHKLNLQNATILDPIAAAAILASRGEWSTLAKTVAAFVRNSNGGNWPVVGTAVTFESLGLAVSDFPVYESGTMKGKPNYSGITMATRAFGLNVRRTVDDFRAFYVPVDPEAMIEKVAAQRAKAAANAKAKTRKTS